jgi:heavy metal translocating P-type ATPase
LTAVSGQLCSHCLVPAGSNPYRGRVAGEEFTFCCCGCYLAYRVRGERGEEAVETLLLLRLGVGAFLAMNVMVLSLLLYTGAVSADQAQLRRAIEIVLAVFATPAMAILGLPIARDAWAAARRRRVSAESMIALGATAAYAYSLLSLWRGEDRVYFDTATMLLLLFTLGRYLDAAARARAARDLAPLIEAERATARVVTAAGEVLRPAAEVGVDELVRVAPGERLPVDGIVAEGRAAIDESMLTGEARPLTRQVGDRVAAGTVNLDGQLVLRTVAAGAATRWAEIGRAVREALGRRSRLQGLVDRVSAGLLPAVLLVALGSGLYWGRRGSTWEALSAALATLVVACPCALGPAAYLASFLGIGMAARRGVLVRSTRALEDLAAVRCVAFDKTGCLTRGRPTLAALFALDGDSEGLLRQAAELAARDDHPLSRALVDAALGHGIAVAPAVRVETRSGLGLCGGDGEERAALGSPELFAELGWDLAPALARQTEAYEQAGYSVVVIGWSGAARGVAALEDEIKSEAPGVVAQLGRRGLIPAIVSGDRPPAVARITAALRVDRWEASLSPADKLAAVRRLEERIGGVAMVGDGLNDGPVLAGATVGIALGSATELARTSAEIVTAGPDLGVLPWLIDLARAVRRTTRVNLAWAFGYNSIGLGLAAAGLLQPVIAAALMAASSVLVVLNSWRVTGGRWSHAAAPEASAHRAAGSVLGGRHHASATLGSS